MINYSFCFAVDFDREKNDAEPNENEEDDNEEDFGNKLMQINRKRNSIKN